MNKFHPLLFSILLININLAGPCFAEDVYKAKTTTAHFHNSPTGNRVGSIYNNLKIKVVEEKGAWVRAEIDGWFLKRSLVKQSAKRETADTEAKAKSPDSDKYFTGLKVTNYKVDLLEPFKSDESKLKKAVLTLVVRNNSDKILRDWRGTLIVKEKSGEFLFREAVTGAGKGIPAKGEREYRFGWSEDDEEYHTLLSQEKPNQAFEIRLANVEAP